MWRELYGALEGHKHPVQSHFIDAETEEYGGPEKHIVMKGKARPDLSDSRLGEKVTLPKKHFSWAVLWSEGQQQV